MERLAVRYAPFGAGLELFRRREPEVLLSGPAGTGKSRACLEKLHLVMSKYLGARGLVVRKTRASLTESALVTFESKVLHPLDAVQWRSEAQEYRYPNGSRLVVAGMDKASKVMSSEYDLAYVQEATELSEGDWEALTTRLRNGVVPYQQVVADCNPDSPLHWLKLRCDAGRTVLLESRHQDNPALWDRARGAWTPIGAPYLAKLDALTGVRRLRLRLGVWAAAEGLVYEGWDRALHLLDRIPVLPGTRLDAAGVPVDWSRYLVVDFGFVHPFCAQWWAADPEGRLYRYREIYRTQRLVEDHAREIARLSAGEPRWRAVVCDHDAEDRATLERHLRVNTVAARKEKSPGLEAVASRLRPQPDGRPRLFYLRGALVERDPDLVDARRPACTEEEFESYVWDLGSGRKLGDEPIDYDNHGMDATRYVVAHLDLSVGRRARGWPRTP